MSDEAGSLTGSAARAVAAGYLHGVKAAAHHLQAARDAHTADTLADVLDELRPVVHALVGQHLSALPDDHPLHALLGGPRTMAGSDGPGTPSGGLTPITQGGVAGAVTDVLLTILGVIGAAIGVIPQMGGIILQEYLNDLRAKFANVPLTPAELADMVERGIIPQAEAAAEAAFSGIDPDRFGLMVLDTGEPPGIMQALELLRRGEMSEAEFRTVVAYSRVRTSYTDQLLKLAYAPMSAADAVELALKQVLSHDEALARFVVAGGMAGDFDPLLDGAGNPIGPERAVELWQHKLITEADLDKVIAHSRINPEFTPIVKLTRYHYLSAFQIETMLKAGTVTAEKATEWLVADGYPPEQVAAFVAGLTGPAAQKAKSDTEGNVVTLYEARMITEEEAVADLAALGYSHKAAAIVLQAAEARRVASQQTAAVGKVRAAYLASRYDADKARGELASLNVPAEAATQAIEAWQVERESLVRTLTAAQVGKAAKDGFATQEWAVERWVAMGYTREDATMLLAIYAGVPPAGSPLAQQEAQAPTSG